MAIQRAHPLPSTQTHLDNLEGKCDTAAISLAGYISPVSFATSTLKYQLLHIVHLIPNARQPIEDALPMLSWKHPSLPQRRRRWLETMPYKRIYHHPSGVTTSWIASNLELIAQVQTSKISDRDSVPVNMPDAHSQHHLLEDGESADVQRQIIAPPLPSSPSHPQYYGVSRQTIPPPKSSSSPKQITDEDEETVKAW
ncbi:hypothetical protein RJZ57_007590 [Blastomyces gilchristii]